MAKRERLGKRTAFSHREYVYRTRDCFEIDEVEGYEVTRKRVFFDDVVLVTRHFFRGWASAIVTAFFAVFLALAAFGMAGIPGGGRIFAFAFFLLALLNLLFALLALTIGGDVVTIQGKRTIARMSFLLRRGRAREVYLLACRVARERQQQLARQIAARERAALPLPAPPVAASAGHAHPPDATMPATRLPIPRSGPRSDR